MIFCSIHLTQAPFRILQQRLCLVVFPITCNTFIKYKCIIQLFNHLFISELSREKHQLIMKCGFREAGGVRGGLQGEKISHLLFRSYSIICLFSLLNKILFHIKIFKSIVYLCQNDIFAQVLNYCSITLFSSIISTRFKHLKILYEIYMRPNLPLKKLVIYVILTFYYQVFGPKAFMTYGTITENDTSEKQATTTSQYTYSLHRDIS